MNRSVSIEGLRTAVIMKESGFTLKEIARTIHVSPRTVSRYLLIAKKLNQEESQFNV